MAAYTTILFDLDGTLVDSMPGMTRALQYALASLGIVENDRTALTPLIGSPLPESFQRYYGLNRAQAQQALFAYREYFTSAAMYDASVYTGIPALLGDLKAAGKNLVVATMKPTPFAEKILAHFRLDGYFKVIVGCNLDQTRYTKTEVIAYVLAEHTPGAKQEIVMIGDREHDVLGAQDNGIDSVAVGYGYGTEAELCRVAPTHKVKTVSELACLLAR